MSSGCVAKECRLCAIEPYSVRHDVGRCARRKAFCVTLELEESAILLDDLASFGNRLRVAASGCPERLAKDPDGHNGFVFAFSISEIVPLEVLRRASGHCSAMPHNGFVFAFSTFRIRGALITGSSDASPTWPTSRLYATASHPADRCTRRASARKAIRLHRSSTTRCIQSG